MLVRVSRGDSYRLVSRQAREAQAREITRGVLKGSGRTSRMPGLAMDCLDVFAPVVIEATAPVGWPRIVALDSWPVRVRDHTSCCGARPRKRKPGGPPRGGHGGKHHTDHDRIWWPPDDDMEPMPFPAWEPDGELGMPPVLPDLPDAPRNRDGTIRRAKIKHAADVKEIGHILVAVGYEKPGAFPRPWLMRFAGGADQVSWAEFLRALPGVPEWVVSDRGSGILPAVAEVWKTATHYFSEPHLAENMADAAREDGITDPADPIWPILEAAQHGPQEWAIAEGAAAARSAEKLGRWLADNRNLAAEQLAKRSGKGLYPRSAGSCEDTIKAMRKVIEDRRHTFRNADRLNLLLALVRADLDGKASVAGYSRVIREHLRAHGGRPERDWNVIRDQNGVSSMLVLLEEAAQRAKAAASKRQAPKKAARHRAKKAIYEAERRALGLAPSPRGKPRVLKATGSVAGTFVADYWWLKEEWHPTLNPDFTPETMPAGSGELIWWRCRDHPDHVWQAQVRSRTIRGTRCRYCTGRAVCPSDSLAVTHPDIAAQWHPTRNGALTPADVTYGSHREVWWQCSKHKSHVWRSRVASRTSMLTTCPLCSRLEGRGGRVRADAENNAAA